MPLPRAFAFSLTRFAGHCCQIELHGDGLSVRQGDGYLEAAEGERIVPRPEQWQAFLAELEQAGVRQWRRRYRNLDICDGTQWQLRLQTAGLNLRLSGDNDFPPDAQWQLCLAALSRLVGRPIDPDGCPPAYL